MSTTGTERRAQLVPFESNFRLATVEFLAGMNEKDLQGRVIEPLLRILGYTHVRDKSGPRERGRDLVAIKEEFGKPKLYAIQIKRVKLRGAIGSSSSIMRIMDQLAQMMREPVIDPTNNVHRPPDRGLFITPYAIHKDAFRAALQGIRDLEQREITLIDGPLLADQVLRNIPEAILQESMELQYRFRVTEGSDKVLESPAFGLHEVLSLDNIYIDIGVCSGMGHLSEVPRRGDRRVGSVIARASKEDVSKLEACWSQWSRMTPRIWQPPRRRRRPGDDTLVELDLDPLMDAIRSQISNHVSQLSAAVAGDIDQTRLNQAVWTGISLQHQLSSLASVSIPSILEHWPALAGPRSQARRHRLIARLPLNAIQEIRYPVFLTGSPGSGKTTLLRRLCQLTARESADHLPILLYLVRVRDPSKEALIGQCVAELDRCGYRTTHAKFRAGLKRGRYHLLLDGLDESGSQAEALLRAIVDLSTDYRKCPIVVTCRDTFPHQTWDRAIHLHLPPLGDEQLSDFIDKWFGAQPSARAGIAAWLQKNARMRKAARSPLIAALLCSLHDVNADMPTTEVDLYEERFALLLGKWERAKGMRPLSSQVRRGYWHFLMTLAFDMHKQECRTVRYTATAEYAGRYHSKQFHGSSDAMIEDFLLRGLLIRDDLGQLSFGHLTYQEYLVARWLSFNNPVEFICSKLCDHWWQKVLQFYAAKRGDITGLIEHLLKSDIGEDRRTAQHARRLAKLAPLTGRRAVRELTRLTTK
jgi:hypothetical protein